MNSKIETQFKIGNNIQLIIDNLDELICIIDSNDNFRIDYINETAFFKVLGLTSRDLIGNSFLDLIHPNDRDSVFKVMKKGFERGNKFLEIKIINRTGSFIWFEFKIMKYKNDLNQKKMLLTLKNISSQKYFMQKYGENEQQLRKLTESIPEIRFWKLFSPKKYEAALKSAYEMLESIMENIPQYIFWKDNDLIYQGCNNNYGKLIDVSFQEGVIGKTDSDLLWDKEKVNHNHIFETRVISSAEAKYHVIESWIQKDGTEIWLDTNRMPITSSDGVVVGILVTYEDINARIVAEFQLKESEEKFRTISEQSLMGICIVQENLIKYINQQGAYIHGYKVDEVLNWKSSEFIKTVHPDDKSFILKQVEETLIRSKDKIFQNQYQSITKNGKIIWLESYAKSISFQGKKAYLFSFIDITDKKEAELKLQESEKKYRNIIENARDALVITGFDGKFKYISPQLSKMLGGLKIDLNISFLEYIHPDDINHLLEIFNKGVKKKEALTSDDIEFRALHEDGHYIWMSSSSKNYYDNDGNVIGFTSLIKDITEKKDSEEKLKESEAKYKHLFENSPNMIILMDKDSSYIDVNTAFLDFTGFKKQDLVSKKFQEVNGYYPGNLPVFKRIYEKLMLNGSVKPIELQFQNKDEDFIWVHMQASTIELEGEKLLHVIIRDINEQKLAEKKIKESEERYRDLLETSTIGLIEVDFRNRDILYLNPKLVEILGYERGEIDDEDIVTKIIKPEDYNKILEIADEKELEFKIHDKEGKVKWLSGRKRTNYNEEGELISFRLWLNDVTEKKMYEKLINELNIMFLKFTKDVQSNIQLLLNTCCSLLSGDLVIYIHKILKDGKEEFQVITSNNEVFTYELDYFEKNLFFNEFFKGKHDFPQTFINLNEFANKDPFLQDTKAEFCYGKLIKTQKELNSLVCVLYRQKPIITNQEKLVLFLTCDPIETERQRWEVQEHLEEQNKVLNEINKIKTELISRTSHELKTPLISIKGFTELLLTVHKFKLDTDTISILNEIKAGSDRLENIISSLLETSKLEHGQMQLNLNNEDLFFLIRICVRDLKGLSDLRNQSITLDIPGELMFKFDKERIYDVIVNILINAIKYTPPDGNIAIKSDIVGDSCIISIKDNGIGLTPKEKEQLFKQFGKIERYGQGWDVDIEGTGLGLYISKKIVNLHGGDIWVESEGRNEGSTFYISLPIVSKKVP